MKQIEISEDKKKKLYKLFQKMQKKEFRLEITVSDKYLKKIKQLIGKLEK